MLQHEARIKLFKHVGCTFSELNGLGESTLLTLFATLSSVCNRQRVNCWTKVSYLLFMNRCCFTVQCTKSTNQRRQCLSFKMEVRNTLNHESCLNQETVHVYSARLRLKQRLVCLGFVFTRRAKVRRDCSHNFFFNPFNKRLKPN